VLQNPLTTKGQLQSTAFVGSTEVHSLPMDQGCQRVSFQTKNSNFGKFWRALGGKMLIFFMAVWNILRRFGIFYEYLVLFVFPWYIFSGFGIMYQEKSGNPAMDPPKYRARVRREQGDQIGRIVLACWALFGQF
jgi:hypothetical protein